MIEKYSFGKFVIDKQTYTTNIKLADEEVSIWFTENHHLLKVKDIGDLVNLKPEIFIIGRGASSVMKVSDEVVSLLKKKKISFIMTDTKSAVREYNKAIKNKRKVAAVMHHTC